MALLLALQAPVFVIQYHQYLEGYFDKSSQIIQEWQTIAIRNKYESLQAMIEHHLENEVPSVRDDAQLKLGTLAEHREIENALALFKEGNLIQKLAFIGNPQHADWFIKVYRNYEPGIPLTLDGLLFAFIAGLILNLICVSPVHCTRWLFRKKKKAGKAVNTQPLKVAPTLSQGK